MSICENPLCDCLRDGAFPRSRQAVQPVDWRLIKIPRPEFDLVKDSFAGSLQTTIAIAVSVFSPLRTAEIIEGGYFSC